MVLWLLYFPLSLLLFQVSRKLLQAEKSQICLRHAMPNFMWCLDFFFQSKL
ncbi:hypothetical protein GLYMA_18G023933v4 [Glycine max]|nr:hypothetical protein GLYMA_18G023933v4 [Glycine max]KAH1152853.1 hypothetical protein GYH30_048794 [Glycine max]